MTSLVVAAVVVIGVGAVIKITWTEMITWQLPGLSGGVGGRGGCGWRLLLTLPPPRVAVMTVAVAVAVSGTDMSGG